MKLVLAEKPSVAQSLAKVLLAKILSNPVLHLHREYCKLGFHLNRGCNTLFYHLPQQILFRDLDENMFRFSVRLRLDFRTQHC